MTQVTTKIETDTWLSITWNKYVQILEDSAYEKASCYYNNGKARIEMTSLGSDHARDDSIISHAVHLFANVRGIDLDGHENCTYRTTGYQDAQPDISFYIGENANAIPWGTKIVNLDDFPPPNLAIEVADTSLSDDKGEKRILYESLNVQEYWIVDVQNVQIIAFAIENGGSRQIRESIVLPGLTFSVLEEVLQQTRQSNHGKVGGWLLTQFQQI